MGPFNFGPVPILALLLVLASGTAWYGLREADRYQGLYKASEQLLKKERDRTARIQKLVQKADKDAATARQDLKEALDENATWRDAAVPGPVRDSLCRTLRCVPARGVPAPAG